MVSSPDGFDFLTTYSEPIRTDPVALLEHDALAWLPLKTQEIVKHWCSGQLAFDDGGTSSTPSPNCCPCSCHQLARFLERL